MGSNDILMDLGWNAHWQSLWEASQAVDRVVCRVVAVQRSGLLLTPPLPNGQNEISIGGKFFLRIEKDRPTIGDWIVVEADSGALCEILPRLSVIKRLSPAGGGEVQLIAANVDTAFVVTSCNADFSVARLERYISMVLDAGIQPVLVLTKADLAVDIETYRNAMDANFNAWPWFFVDARAATDVAALAPWCGQGQTIALLGSSGVGKSTLVNTLSGATVQLTRAVREQDAKGRHTTTHRSLHFLPQGGVILDSPGMREFQLADTVSGVGAVFADIEDLARSCRFRDCRHGAEPGCAIREALQAGRLDPERLQRYLKLIAEAAASSEVVSQRQGRGRAVKKDRPHIPR